MRIAYRVLLGVVVLGALAYGAVRLRPSVALTRAPLADLMEGCAEAAVQKAAGPVARHLLVPVESGYRAARVNTDVGPVTLLLEYRADTGELFACAIAGNIWADEASIRTPAVSWGKAMPVVSAWFEGRLRKPGHVALPIDGPFRAAYCPGDGREGIFLDAGPGDYGAQTTGMLGPFRPMSVRFAHTASAPEMACQLVAQGG